MRREILIMTLLMFLSLMPVQPTFRLTTEAYDLLSHSVIEDAKMFSVFDDGGDIQFFDSWRYCDNISLYASSYDYLRGELMNRFYTADGYYCTGDEVVVPLVPYYTEFIEVCPARLVRRCSEYEVGVVLDETGMTISLHNQDEDSSFGWYGYTMYDLDTLATMPVVIVAFPDGPHGAIFFSNTNYELLIANGWRYYIFDFPVVINDNAAYEDSVGAVNIGYELLEAVNLSVTILDGFDYNTAIVEGGGFPLPDESTFAIDFDNQTEIGEVLVEFMPQVEIGDYSSWSPPHVYPVPTEIEPEPTNDFLAIPILIVIVLVPIYIFVIWVHYGKRERCAI